MKHGVNEGLTIYSIGIL